MEKINDGKSSALVVSSWALNWAVTWRAGLHFHNKSKQPSWRKACKLKNQVELVSCLCLVGSASRFSCRGRGFQVEVEGTAWMGRHSWKWGSSSGAAPGLCEGCWWDQGCWCLGQRGPTVVFGSSQGLSKALLESRQAVSTFCFLQ